MPVEASELYINAGASAMRMARELFGEGIRVLGARYSGDWRSSGIWRGGDDTSPGPTPSDRGVIFSTGRVWDFTNSYGNANQSPNTSTNTYGVDNDSDFNSLASRPTYDASFLEVNFRPTTDFISIQFTFASEEYPEYVGSIFNDAVGIWVNGVEVASPVFNIAEINNVNNTSNQTLYVDNTTGNANTEMDGYTVTLSVKIPVNANVTNSIKLGIADVGDSSFDSAILVASNSIQGAVLANNDSETVIQGQTANVDVIANDQAIGVMVVTHINGQAVSAGDSVTLNNGFTVTLLADGTLDVEPPAGYGGLTAPESFNFSYTAESADGITDTAFVTITSIPCFTAGTRIRTDRGDVPIETLEPGDLVKTRDNGFQPIRWIGCREVAAEGNFAPIVIEPNTLGNHKKLTLSPQHRVLIKHYMAQLLFAEDEVLVAAKDLVNDRTIYVKNGGTVEYYHLLFDEHQMIWSEGLLTESFQPGPQTLPGFDDDIQEELYTLFPELREDCRDGYGPAARATIKGYEALAMLA